MQAASDNIAAPEVVSEVFAAVGDDASVAFAPATMALMGEECGRSGGFLLTTALNAYAAVGIEEVPTPADAPDGAPQLIVVHRRQEHRLPIPDSAPTGYPDVVVAVAATIAAMTHSVHIIPRSDRSLKVTIASTIPARRGFHELPAIQCALALAINKRWGDQDNVPNRTRYASAIRAMTLPEFGPHWPLYPYTTALRSRANSFLCINHADDAVNQIERPNGLALLAAYSPDITAGSAPVDRSQFLTEACVAFGVTTLHELPDASRRVLDWLQARHEVHPDQEAPSVGRASGWLDDAWASSDRARAAAGYLRHADVTAALAGVNRDAHSRDAVPAAGSGLGEILGQLGNHIDSLAQSQQPPQLAIRLANAPAATVAVWTRDDHIHDIADHIHDHGGKTLSVQNTCPGLAVE